MISLPKGVDLNDLIGFLRDIGLKASSILRNLESESLPLYGSSDNLNLINNEDGPVTVADLTLNKLFTTQFISRYPYINWQVITEENSKLVPFQESNCDWIWLIDPLDGTKDFIQRTGEYAVHVALMFKNKPVLGMVLIPKLEEIWFGIDSLGTWKEKEKSLLENKKSSLPNKKFQSFSKRHISKVVTSKNHNNQKLEIILKEMNYQNILKMGSIGFKVCSLLRGEADVYISISDKTAPKDWDLAAPHALIKSAGCNFTYVSGDEIHYQKNNYQQEGCLIASTLIIEEHLNICRKINSIINKYDF